MLFAFLALTVPAAGAPWTRSFVVTGYEPAFLYGGPPGSTAAPGSDCPGGTNRGNDYGKMLQTGWRSAADIAELMKPALPSIEPDRLLAPALHFRGFAPGIDTYINPFAAPDPGLIEVTGPRAEGFDLDGKTSTGGFVSPSPQVRGIDNALYRAWGCLPAFRGPPGMAPLSQRANQRMLGGLYTMVIRLSGRQAPTNDATVSVELAWSPDPLVRNIAGQVLRDYSYRLATGAQYTHFSGQMRKGVLTAGPVAQLKAPDFAWSQSNRGEALFRNGQMTLTIAADGSATGLIGGYRDWRELYARDTFNVALEGPFVEIAFSQDQIAMYYALQRNADAFPDGQGRNSAISTAYRLTAVPAFAVDPATPVRVSEPVPSPRIAREQALFRAAQASHAIAPSP